MVVRFRWTFHETDPVERRRLLPRFRVTRFQFIVMKSAKENGRPGVDSLASGGIRFRCKAWDLTSEKDFGFMAPFHT